MQAQFGMGLNYLLNSKACEWSHGSLWPSEISLTEMNETRGSTWWLLRPLPILWFYDCLKPVKVEASRLLMLPELRLGSCAPWTGAWMQHITACLKGKGSTLNSSNFLENSNFCFAMYFDGNLFCFSNCKEGSFLLMITSSKITANLVIYSSL